MNIIKPEKLKTGETIAIIAPAGNVNKDNILNSVKYFESLGYKIKLGKNIFKQNNYLAGTDYERLEDLHKAFEDKEVKAIICARGGYGSIRLISQIDYNLIRNNPKIFCGYSDITALSLMILNFSGLITFSSPMPKSDFQPENLDVFTLKNFWKTLESNNISIQAENLFTYNCGDAQGRLIGGNLATIASLCGMDFIPDEKFILFVEDLCEPVYKIDRYLTQLFNIKKFSNNISALILGDFLNENDNPMQQSKEFQNLFNEFSKKINIPMYGGYAISHLPKKLTLPIGGECNLINGTLDISY